MEAIDKEEKVARISDIIEQIEELNKMIDLHRGHQGDLSTITQYEYMRSTFVKELNELMGDFKLDVRLTEHAA
jgi:hypothetical protein